MKDFDVKAKAKELGFKWSFLVKWSFLDPTEIEKHLLEVYQAGRKSAFEEAAKIANKYAFPGSKGKAIALQIQIDLESKVKECSK